jgi:hypothetical protein
MAKKSGKAHEVELEPDAWPRFERFVHDIAKAGPQHKAVKAATKVKRRSQKTVSTKSAKE